MKYPLIVGITGGIGGGKSTLSEVLRKKGFLVYDTDRAAKRLQKEDKTIINRIKETFGNSVYTENGLDRKLLATIVFTNKELLHKLNEIVHPAVRKDFFDWIEKNSTEKVLFVESAIMFESGFSDFVDKIIVVTAPENIRIMRVMKRDGVTAEHVLARIKRQMPEQEKINKADIVLNSHGKRVLTQNVNKLLVELNLITREQNSPEGVF